MAPPRLKLAKKTTAQTLPVNASESDFLERGDDFEEAMGKHRVGDPAKAVRFARRAVDLYSQGLEKFPRSFDLAYNKARLELEMATDSALSEALDLPVRAVLQQALASHTYALELDPLHADTQFNMAQVLTTMAEHTAKHGADDFEAIRYVERALEHQARCLEIQQAAFVENRVGFERAIQETRELAASAVDDAQPPADDAMSESRNENRVEEWVSIEEPVTADTLLDTIIAQIESLISLCSILISTLDPSIQMTQASVRKTFTGIISYSVPLLTETLPNLLVENKDALEPRLAEVMLPRAIFVSKNLELFLRYSIIDVEKFKLDLDSAFSMPGLKPASKDTLMAHADALISFNTVLADYRTVHPAPETYAALRWKILIEAQSYLSSVAKLPKADDVTVARTHLLRGNIALFMQMLAYVPTSYPQAQELSSQLLNHAEVYYQNASKLYGVLGSEAAREKSICDFRGAVVSIIKQVTTSQTAAGDSSGPNSPSTFVCTSASREQIDEAFNPISKIRGERWSSIQLGDMVNEHMVQAEVFETLANV
ncbi:hypothetical protein GGR50DRAFT_659837 [Xylaria sp. CBS 124048]|nr:hypothetical protein GGR50DRAFT_659837 [Xylaria sp. CBS 124048]